MASTRVIDGLRALAQSTRLTAMRQLLAAHPNNLSAGEIARRCRVPHNTMSTHLGILMRAGLADVERDGRVMNYRANVRGIQALLTFLVQDCWNGRTDLCFDPVSSFEEPDRGVVPPDSMIPAFNVLFLCTHNSARSIMAEALLQRLGNGLFRAYSAGTEPACRPLPEVVERLGALGHDTTGLRSKPWSDFRVQARHAWISLSRFATSLMSGYAGSLLDSSSQRLGRCPIRRNSVARRRNARRSSMSFMR
jgi:DNA-binding transcriptional ArsR family regulator